MGRLSKVMDKVNSETRAMMEEVKKDLVREQRLAMIQALIPLGLMAVQEELQREIEEIVGPRYGRGGEAKRWGKNQGSVFVFDQKLSTPVPRARNVSTGQEIPLKSYQRLQSQQQIDELVFSRVIHGMSQGNYKKAALEIPETFGIKKSSVGKKFIRASAKRLQDFSERRLNSYDIVAVFIDGKYFADVQIVIAMGITLKGEKVLLGFVETSTENHIVCRDFLRGLKERGLNLTNEILFILDGGKGLHKGVREVVGDKAVIQRCQWHKRENVVSYLEKSQQKKFRKKLQKAYNEASYSQAKKALNSIGRELKLMNKSALASLEEGLEETLTLHRLGLYKKIGTSFKTTNCIENVNRSVGRMTDRVDRWRNSDQRHRWVSSALLEIEPKLRKVKGAKHLSKLRDAMKKLNGPQSEIMTLERAA